MDAGWRGLVVAVKPRRRLVDTLTLVLPPVVLLVFQFLVISSPRGPLDISLIVVAYAVLLLRRRWPAIALIASNMGMLSVHTLTIPAMTVALYAVAAARTRRVWNWIPVAVTCTVFALTLNDPTYIAGSGLTPQLYVVVGLLIFLFVIGGSLTAGELVHTRRAADATTVELKRGRDREKALLAATVLARERTRLAREMHDVVSHQVSLIAVQAGALRVAAPSGPLADHAESVRALSAATLDELRRMVGALRAPPSDCTDTRSAQPQNTDVPPAVATTSRQILDAVTLTLPLFVVIPQFMLIQSPRTPWDILALVALYTVLLLRRRWPISVLAVTSLGLLLPYWTAAPVFFALYSVAAARTRRWWHWLAISLAGTLYAVLGAIRDIVGFEPGHSSAQYVAAWLLTFVLTIVAPVVVGEMAQARRATRMNLAVLRSWLDREKAMVAATVLTQERARLANEMHDVVTHKIALIAVEAGALKVLAPTEKLRDQAESIRTLSSTASHELRQMVKVLREPSDELPSTAPQPRLADIPALVAPSGPKVTVRVAPEVHKGQWPEAVQRSAYRTVQEALTNVRKHAPNADVSVVVTAIVGGLDVLVENGPATGSEQLAGTGGGHGLIGLKERADLLDGTFEAGATSDGGFRVHARYPVPAIRNPEPAGNRMRSGGAGLSPA